MLPILHTYQPYTLTTVTAAITCIAGIAMVASNLFEHPKKEEQKEALAFYAKRGVIGLLFVVFAICSMIPSMIEMHEIPIVETTEGGILAMTFACAAFTLIRSPLVSREIIVSNIALIAFFPAMYLCLLDDPDSRLAVESVSETFVGIMVVVYFVAFFIEKRRFKDTVNGYYDLKQQKTNTKSGNLIITITLGLWIWWAIDHHTNPAAESTAFEIARTAAIVLTATYFIIESEKALRIARIRNCLESD